MPASTLLNKPQQRALFKLKGKLAWRQFIHEPGKFLITIVRTATLLPIVVISSIFTLYVYWVMSDFWASHTLLLSLVFLWGASLVAPLLSLSANESLDLTRLMIYPIQRRDLMLFVIAGKLLETPLLLPFMIVIFLGWGFSPAFPLVVIALLVIYLHIVMTGQLLLIALGGLFESRYFKEITIFLFMSMGFIFYALENKVQAFFDWLESTRLTVELITSWQLLEWAKWIPPGAIAKSIVLAEQGDWGNSLVWLGYAGILALLIGWVWIVLLERWLTGGGYLIHVGTGSGQKKDKAQPSAQPAWQAQILTIIPDAMWQLMLKEWRSMWRYPQRRYSLLYFIIAPLFFGGVGVWQIGTNEQIGLVSAGKLLQMIIPLYGMWIIWSETMNMLGFEGSGLPALLSSPVPRVYIFRAKALAMFTLHTTVLVVIMIIGLVWAGQIGVIAALLTAIGGMMAIFSVGSLWSVFFPVYVPLESTRRQNLLFTGGGCVTAIATAVFMPTLNLIISGLAVAPFLAATWFEWTWLTWLASLWAVGYGGILIWFATKHAGQWLVKREAEILIATRPPE